MTFEKILEKYRKISTSELFSDARTRQIDYVLRYRQNFISRTVNITAKSNDRRMVNFFRNAAGFNLRLL